MQLFKNIQYVYLLNKYLKCSVSRLALRYDIYIYIDTSLGFKRSILSSSALCQDSEFECSLRYIKQQYFSLKSINRSISVRMTLCLDEFWSLWLGQSIVSE